MNIGSHFLEVLSYFSSHLAVWKCHGDTTVYFCYDSLAVGWAVNSLSKSLGALKFVWAFSLHCLQLNLLFLVKHVLENGVADALSCKQVERFHQLAPDADP